MFDLRACSSGGGTTSTRISTIAVNDGANVVGIPIRSGGYLKVWGGMTTIADTIREIQLQSLDQIDVQNSENFVWGASSLRGIFSKDTNLYYQGAARNIFMRQNTAGANNLGFYIDSYPSNNYGIPGPYSVTTLQQQGNYANNIVVSMAALSALTAITWSVGNAFAPGTALKPGIYGLLGFWVNALTNYGLIRFSHADFMGFKPGFPVTDRINNAAARAVDVPDRPTLWDGYQFLKYRDVPVFSVGAAATGLTVEAIAITADSPIITLNLTRLA